MTTLPNDRVILELLGNLQSKQQQHTALSRNTNEIVHGLKVLRALVEPLDQNSPGGETAPGLVQALIDQLFQIEQQLKRMEISQERNAAQFLAESRNQTNLLKQMAGQLGLQVGPLSV